MFGWIGRWIAGWNHEWIVWRKDVHEWVNGWLDEWVAGWWIDVLMDRWIDIWSHGLWKSCWMVGRMVG